MSESIGEEMCAIVCINEDAPSIKTEEEKARFKRSYKNLVKASREVIKEAKERRS